MGGCMGYFNQGWVWIFSMLAIIFGGEILVVQIWVLMMILDFITGVARSRKSGAKISSAVMREKTFTKLMAYLIPLMVLALIMTVVNVTFPALLPAFIFLQSLIVLGYIINEGVSVLENLSELAPQLATTKSLLAFLRRNKANIEHQIDDICKEEAAKEICEDANDENKEN